MRQERAYRRGTVAGLSLGEVFILLSFVLVLTVLMSTDDFPRESGLGFVGTSDAKNVTPPDPELIQTLTADLGTARDELGQARALVKNRDWRISELTQEIQQLEAELVKAIEQRKRANEHVQRLESELADANNEIRDMREARINKNEKGSNPPCWYERVPAVGGQGTREKAIYALDLLVSDSQIQFGNRGLPPGAAEESESRGRSFAEEAEMLGLPNVPYGVWLTHAQASNELRKLADAGGAGEVRTYPCKFFVKVWDQTGTGQDSKDNWRHIRENVIERFVLIYRVKDDPWPH